MRLRGQGAMEYLMSYGWAVLVVLAVGATLWQLGLLTSGGSVPATMQGFQELKPLLPTCQLSNALYPDLPDVNGFQCQFAHPGTPVTITDLEVQVNGGYCNVAGALITNEPSSAMPSAFSELFVNLPPSGTPGFHWCFNNGLDRCAAGRLAVEADELFTIEAHNMGVLTAGGGICNSLSAGSVYNVLVEVTYETTLGGLTSVRRSSGTVRLAAVG